MPTASLVSSTARRAAATAVARSWPAVATASAAALFRSVVRRRPSSRAMRLRRRPTVRLSTSPPQVSRRRHSGQLIKFVTLGGEDLGGVPWRRRQGFMARK